VGRELDSAPPSERSPPRHLGANGSHRPLLPAATAAHIGSRSLHGERPPGVCSDQLRRLPMAEAQQPAESPPRHRRVVVGGCRGRRDQTAAPKPRAPRPRPPRALDDVERAEVLAVLDSDPFADKAHKAPAQVYAALLDAGRYLCSVRSMYRVLAAADQVRERREPAAAPDLRQAAARGARAQPGLVVGHRAPRGALNRAVMKGDGHRRRSGSNLGIAQSHSRPGSPTTTHSPRRPSRPSCVRLERGGVRR
jgi:hypothetical protein